MRPDGAHDMIGDMLGDKLGDDVESEGGGDCKAMKLCEGVAVTSAVALVEDAKLGETLAVSVTAAVTLVELLIEVVASALGDGEADADSNGRHCSSVTLPSPLLAYVV